jgi:hypothetical protein
MMRRSIVAIAQVRSRKFVLEREIKE